MNDQFGFDFGDDQEPAFAEHAAGAWNAPHFTTAQYVALFATASEAVRCIVGAGRTLFEKGIAAAKAQHAEMLARRTFAEDEAYRLWRSSFHPTPAALEAFIAHCFAHDGTHYNGIQYKTRREARMATAAMYAQDVGTIIVRQYASGSIGVDYHPWRDAFFLCSYRDDLSRIYVPCATWAVAYCADRIANASDGIANVPTFAINGREYINDGGMSQGKYRECEGWTFRVLAEWRGPTYSYRTQCQAWNEGRTERGDRRGLVVNVRGQRCVLDGVALIYDDNATDAAYMSADDVTEDDVAEDDDELPEDIEGDVCELDELAA